MPGKVNPVIPEVVNEIAFQVIGSDVTVTMAAEAGQLELNAMLPVIAYNLFLSINILDKGCIILTDRCVSGITANRENCLKMAMQSLGLATALNPVIGYEKAGEVAKKALETGRSIADVVLEQKLVSREELEEILKPENMIRPKNFSRRNAC